MTRASFTLLFVASLVAIGCGSRLGPRISVPAEQANAEQYRRAYAAFWWNCAIVKSIDLGAACPSTCEAAPAETAAYSAGAADAENQIAELEKNEGPDRTRELLSLRIAEEDAHARITPYFPYGPTSGRPPSP